MALSDDIRKFAPVADAALNELGASHAERAAFMRVLSGWAKRAEVLETPRSPLAQCLGEMHAYFRARLNRVVTIMPEGIAAMAAVLQEAQLCAGAMQRALDDSKRDIERQRRDLEFMEAALRARKTPDYHARTLARIAAKEAGVDNVIDLSSVFARERLHNASRHPSPEGAA
jgi:hypothetical protein